MRELKKASVIALVILLSMALAACSSAPAQQPAQQTQGEPAPVEAAQPEAEPSPKDEGDLGDFHLKIGDWFLTKDYQGNDAIVVNYTFTNNGKEGASFLTSIGTKAFQDGIQLETAMLMNVDGFDSENSMKEIKPGAALDVQQAYLLDSAASAVEIEATEWISFNEDALYKLIEIA